MTALSCIASLLRNLFRKRHAEQELEDEVNSYLELLIERKIERGVDQREAARLSLIEMGGIEQLKERVREVSMGHRLDTLLQDLRYGARTLVENPLFSGVAIITLALGIGANTAIFSAVSALLIRQLPYKDPSRLIYVNEVGLLGKEDYVPGPHFLEWVEQSKMLEKAAAYRSRDFTLTGSGNPERLDGIQVSREFFTTLGVTPLLGRDFTPPEDLPKAPHAAVISHSLWHRHFGADQGIVGKSVVLDDQGYTVVGVLPADFRFSAAVDICVPLALDTQREHADMTSILRMIARLNPDVTAAQAQTELEGIRARFESSKPPGFMQYDGQVRVLSLHDKLAGNSRGLLLILLGAVSLILLIGCANVANLLLSRGAARQREFSIRTALGARRMRLIRQMLTESALLAVTSGVVGLALAFLLTEALSALAAENTFGDISLLTTINIDARVLGFTLIVSCITGGLFGLAPAIRLSRPNTNDSLKESAHGASHPSKLRHLLMITEVAMAIVLLAGAGLLIRSFVNLMQVSTGFQTEHLLTMRVTLSNLRFQQANQKEGFYRDVLQRFALLPGVESVGAINHLPLTGYQNLLWLRIPGRPQTPGGSDMGTPVGIVNTHYFRTMGIPLRSGRFFTDEDRAQSQRIVILSEALARSLFPDEDPLGKQIMVPHPVAYTPPNPARDSSIVVGVVGDVRHQGLDKDIAPEAYVPYTQNPSGSMMMVIRTASDPAAMATAARNEVSEVDQDVPIYEVRTMDDRISSSISTRRSSLLLLGVFAALALALAAIGVYGVIAYVVTQRTHEIGIRIALGARGADVMRMLIGQGMAVVAIGIAIGLSGAWMLTRVMKTLLFHVGATDPLTFVGVAIVLAAVAWVACYIPARKASRVDPMIALRYE